MQVYTTARSLIISYQQYIHQMSSHKNPERRTYLQDRLEILIKKQRSGTASFNELTELDDMVNRDPAIRKMIIMDSFFPDEPGDLHQSEEIADLPVTPAIYQSLLSKFKLFIGRIFNSQTTNLRNVPARGQLMLI